MTTTCDLPTRDLSERWRLVLHPSGRLELHALDRAGWCSYGEFDTPEQAAQFVRALAPERLRCPAAAREVLQFREAA